MKSNDKNLRFISNLIGNIKYARFYAETDMDFCLPNNVIEAINTDEAGNVYFITSCTSYFITGNKKSFFARLIFTEKNSGALLCVSGKAEAEKLMNDKINGAYRVLIRLKMINVEFTPSSHSAKKQPAVSKMFGFIAQWLSPMKPLGYFNL